MKSEKNKAAQNQFGQQNSEQIQELINCALACEACAATCLQENDVTMMTRCIELNRDCADICFQAARLLMRESEVTDKFLTVSEEICRLCAEECNKHNAEHCKLCAETCERCANVCHPHHGNEQLN